MKTILLAWDSRIEVTWAARAAPPFLKGARTIHIASENPEPQIDECDLGRGTNIATYLTRHNVSVTIGELPTMGWSVAHVLICHAKEIATDLIVMGAYDHSRRRKRIFTDVTKAMLKEMPASLRCRLAV
ncbi:universal stress protein [Methylovirgula sp. 4M-Z18]|uniref:universal stress protein n=1 Tax=Methylovirgula sp. 4M-Z18 TaxID=2293567 RepID=UPI000E2F1883|nr:universal stress protein [Methylovirgula sp. 4M-Z18]RFB76480.1 universal stress protein [Methylovirgula sp. 4M-Z18]